MENILQHIYNVNMGHEMRGTPIKTETKHNMQSVQRYKMEIVNIRHQLRAQTVTRKHPYGENKFFRTHFYKSTTIYYLCPRWVSSSSIASEWYIVVGRQAVQPRRTRIVEKRIAFEKYILSIPGSNASNSLCQKIQKIMNNSQTSVNP